MTTLPTKTIMQPSGDTLTTSRNVTFLLPKLPQDVTEAYRISGLTNNLLSASALSDATCELYFHQTGRNNSPRVARPNHQTLSKEENIVPNIVLPTESIAQVNSIYECENTHQLINFLCHHGLPSDFHIVQIHRPGILPRVDWPDLN
ncbi:hypothetical protein ACHAW6_005130 [Cyclotella cf. meneghiniana]